MNFLESIWLIPLVPFGGIAAIRYAYERALYESLLAIRLVSARLEKNGDSVKESRSNK